MRHHCEARLRPESLAGRHIAQSYPRESFCGDHRIAVPPARTRLPAPTQSPRTHYPACYRIATWRLWRLVSPHPYCLPALPALRSAPDIPPQFRFRSFFEQNRRRGVSVRGSWRTPRYMRPFQIPGREFDHRLPVFPWRRRPAVPSRRHRVEENRRCKEAEETRANRRCEARVLYCGLGLIKLVDPLITVGEI